MKLAKLIAKNLVKYGKVLGVKSCTLIRAVPGAREAGRVAGGMNPVETTYAAKGYIEETADVYIAGALVRRGDLKITLLGATIAGGQVPKSGDKIAMVDPTGELATYRIAPDGPAGKGVEGDGLGVQYSCRVVRVTP